MSGTGEVNGWMRILIIFIWLYSDCLMNQLDWNVAQFCYGLIEEASGIGKVIGNWR